MSRGTPITGFRLTVAERQALAAYQQAHELPDLTAAMRQLLQQQPVVKETSSADVLAWWDKHMKLYRAQKWYAEARQALADQV